MGLDRGECWLRTERSSRSGHQSLFVRGRVCFGVGEGIAGFSLSLPLVVTSLVSDTSVLLLSWCFVILSAGSRLVAPDPGLRHPVTLSPSHPVTQSPSHPVT